MLHTQCFVSLYWRFISIANQLVGVSQNPDEPTSVVSLSGLPFYF
ncbi:MAG: hypothetical protein AAFO04_15285 [Cyanobacteria bacterium J06592_8]